MPAKAIPGCSPDARMPGSRTQQRGFPKNYIEYRAPGGWSGVGEGHRKVGEPGRRLADARRGLRDFPICYHYHYHYYYYYYYYYYYISARVQLQEIVRYQNLILENTFYGWANAWYRTDRAASSGPRVSHIKMLRRAQQGAVNFHT